VECVGNEVRHDVEARDGDEVACPGDCQDGRDRAVIEDRALSVGEADIVLLAIDHPGPCAGLAQPSGTPRVYGGTGRRKRNSGWAYGVRGSMHTGDDTLPAPRRDQWPRASSW